MLRRRVPAQSLRPMWVTRLNGASSLRRCCVIRMSNASLPPCSQPLSRRAAEILERLHALLPEDQRPELSRPAQEKSRQHHEAGSRGPHAVSSPAAPLTQMNSLLLGYPVSSITHRRLCPPPGLLRPPPTSHRSLLPAPPGPTTTASPSSPAWCARGRRRACLWRRCRPASTR